jgi:hypothetical protein
MRDEFVGDDERTPAAASDLRLAVVSKNVVQ